MTFITFIIALINGFLFWRLMDYLSPMVKRYLARREVRQIQTLPIQKLPLDNYTVLVEWLGRDKSKDLNPPRFETLEAPKVGECMSVANWHVKYKNKHAVDVEYVEVLE